MIMANFEPFDGKFGGDKEYAVCIGSGRFLRAVFVPVLTQTRREVIIAQTRGDSFVNAVVHDRGAYEVDTVQRDGSITTETFHVAAVGSLGSPEGRSKFMHLPAQLKNIRIIGLGVTESGINKESQALLDLAEFLYQCFKHLPTNHFSVINTDNVPENGTKIRECVLRGRFLASLSDKSSFEAWLDQSVVFHNTMVDRIVAARPSDSNVPYAEPLPRKALVIEDLKRSLPDELENCPGVILRRGKGQIEVDHLLKLRIANGIHTSMVYVMALSKMERTTQCIEERLILDYIEVLFNEEILPGLLAKGVEKSDALEAYEDWMHRLTHPHFGMDCFFVCQNATLKLGIRVLSSVLANLEHNPNHIPSPAVAFAAASALRFITPLAEERHHDHRGTTFTGRVDPHAKLHANNRWEYTTGLNADLGLGTYQLRDPNEKVPLALESLSKGRVAKEKVEEGIKKILEQVEYVDMKLKGFQLLAKDVAHLYEKMLNGNLLHLLKEVANKSAASSPLTSDAAIRSFVHQAVQEVRPIDVHTHLYPANHGQLMLWGIDELLTYHYLVAEFFITASHITPEEFFRLDKKAQAELVWQGLFVERSPISEACRGVITTLKELGLGELVEKRDLAKIREWFGKQTADSYVDKVFELSRLKYVLMTNIPFEKREAEHWYPQLKEFNHDRFKAALRVDQLLTGDWEKIKEGLDAMGFEHSVEGVKQYLEKWISIMRPIYFMAAVPPNMPYPSDEELSTYSPSTINAATLLRRVLLPLAEQHRLPIAFKFDSVRPINPRLREGGDGVEKTSGVKVLQQLCHNYPKIKFLATFLARVNQHELTVLANKFGNLHLYGCWWYCNNPSIVEEMTRMRVELLGTAFTAQHSDARVLDQLVYKWKHSKEVIGKVLQDMYVKVHQAGWKLTREEIRRDVERLFGGAYEEFLQK